MANNTSFNRTPPLHQPIQDRVKNTARQAWGSYRATPHEPSAFSLLWDKWDEYCAKRQEKKRAAKKAMISKPFAFEHYPDASPIDPVGGGQATGVPVPPVVVKDTKNKKRKPKRTSNRATRIADFMHLGNLRDEDQTASDDDVSVNSDASFHCQGLPPPVPPKDHPAPVPPGPDEFEIMATSQAVHYPEATYISAEEATHSHAASQLWSDAESDRDRSRRHRAQGELLSPWLDQHSDSVRDSFISADNHSKRPSTTASSAHEMELLQPVSFRSARTPLTQEQYPEPLNYYSSGESTHANPRQHHAEAEHGPAQLTPSTDEVRQRGSSRAASTHDIEFLPPTSYTQRRPSPHRSPATYPSSSLTPSNGAHAAQPSRSHRKQVKPLPTEWINSKSENMRDAVVSPVSPISGPLPPPGQRAAVSPVSPLVPEEARRPRPQPSSSSPPSPPRATARGRPRVRRLRPHTPSRRREMSIGSDGSISPLLATDAPRMPFRPAGQAQAQAQAQAHAQALPASLTTGTQPRQHKHARHVVGPDTGSRKAKVPRGRELERERRQQSAAVRETVKTGPAESSDDGGADRRRSSFYHFWDDVYDERKVEAEWGAVRRRMEEEARRREERI